METKGISVSATTDHVPLGELAAEISNATVRLLSEYTGRGPTRARTHINGDLVTVLLRDTLTKGEQSLRQSGKDKVVLATRKAYQETMAPDLIQAIEQITGRNVEAFLSDNHLEPDIAIEVFVLAPTN